MMQGFLVRRRGKAPSRDKGGDRTPRPPPSRQLDSSMEVVEGMLAGDRGGVNVEKKLVHSEWTKEPFPDDFDDEDLD